MNRRLYNSYSAIVATGSLLVLGLMLATPAAMKVETVATRAETIPVQVGALHFTFTPDHASTARSDRAKALARSIERRAGNVETLADAAALTAEIATAAALAGTLRDVEDADADNESPRSSNPSRHRSRQSLAMPYFSFAPRG
jgi:hypothetical protein